MSRPDFSSIITANPTGFITRENITKATGGLIPSPRHMANLDCRGEGIKERFKIGRRVAYPVESVIDFLEKRVQTI